MRPIPNIKSPLWRQRLAGGFATRGGGKNPRPLLHQDKRDAGGMKIGAVLDKRPQSKESGRSGYTRASDFR